MSDKITNDLLNSFLALNTLLSTRADEVLKLLHKIDPANVDEYEHIKDTFCSFDDMTVQYEGDDYCGDSCYFSFPINLLAHDADVAGYAYKIKNERESKFKIQKDKDEERKKESRHKEFLELQKEFGNA